MNGQRRRSGVDAYPCRRTRGSPLNKGSPLNNGSALRTAVANRTPTSPGHASACFLDRNRHEEPGLPCGLLPAAGNLLVACFVARGQDGNLVRRRRHSSCGECKGGWQPLFSIGRSKRHELVRRDRETFDLVGREFLRGGTSSAYQNGRRSCNRQSICHNDLHSLGHFLKRL